MLKVLRDNLKYLSWILWVVIIVFIGFVFIDFGGARLGGQGRGVAAQVGDRQVTYADFQRRHRNLDQRYRSALGDRYTPEVAKQLRVRTQALEQLVGQQILLAEAERYGLAVSDEEVRRAILEAPSFQDEQGGFVGEELYRDFLLSEGLTPAQFERSVRDELVVERLMTLLGDGLRVADAEVEAAYRERSDQAKIQHLYLPATRYFGQAQATPAEVQAHFDAHREELRLPIQRLVDYLLVDAARLRATVQVSPEEIERQYRERQDEFRQDEQLRARHILLRVDDQRSEAQARQEMTALRSQLEGGADFAALARERSDDPGSKANGGDLGFFGRGRMIKEFEEAAFAATVGQLVGPIRTAFGFHLLQVQEKRPAGVRPLAEVEGQIRAQLAAQRVEAMAQEKINALAARVRNEKLTTAEQLKALADNESVFWQTTPPFGAEEVVPGIGRGTPFSTAAFALAAGKPSDPVKIPRGWAILSLAEERPSRLPELADVEAKVRQAVLNEKLQRLALAELVQVRAKVAAGTSFEEAAKGLNVQPQESPLFGPGGNIPGIPSPEPVVQAALALDEGALGGPVAVPNGAVLFRVLERKRFDPAAFAAAKEATRQELVQREQNALLESLLTQRKLELKVTYDRPLVEELGLAEAGGVPAAPGR